MCPDPLGLADLVRRSLPRVPEDRWADVRAVPRAAGAAPPGDELRDVPAELSALLRDLASAPEAPVDVASGWAPGLAPGDVVGRFELVRETRRGGLGVVYEAVDRELEGRVAFTAVRPGRRMSAHGDDWLRAEAEAVGRLRHPGVVPLRDFGRGPSGPYLVFDLLEGETVAGRLRAGALPLRQAVGVAIEVARVLAHAHCSGVIHRDLNPANVFLGEDGTVKVLDFGLAHLFGRGGPVTGGTPAYMAPEQWREPPGDGRTDVFALGVLLPHRISGAVPYRAGRDRSEALDPGPPPLLRRTAAPPALRSLVARMLEKDPAERPGPARRVLHELVAAQRRLAGAG
jgi:serine/threonine protein kinase